MVKVRDLQLLGGQAMVSGEIARSTDYEAMPAAMRVMHTGEDAHDTLPGEQAIIFHLNDRGLVVLTACGHAGRINTVHHIRG